MFIAPSDPAVAGLVPLPAPSASAAGSPGFGQFLDAAVGAEASQAAAQTDQGPALDGESAAGAAPGGFAPLEPASEPAGDAESEDPWEDADAPGDSVTAPPLDACATLTAQAFPVLAPALSAFAGVPPTSVPWASEDMVLPAQSSAAPTASTASLGADGTQAGAAQPVSWTSATAGAGARAVPFGSLHAGGRATYRQDGAAESPAANGAQLAGADPARAVVADLSASPSVGITPGRPAAVRIQGRAAGRSDQPAAVEAPATALPAGETPFAVPDESAVATPTSRAGTPALTLMDLAPQPETLIREPQEAPASPVGLVPNGDRLGAPDAPPAAGAGIEPSATEPLAGWPAWTTGAPQAGQASVDPASAATQGERPGVRVAPGSASGAGMPAPAGAARADRVTEGIGIRATDRPAGLWQAAFAVTQEQSIQAETPEASPATLLPGGEDAGRLTGGPATAQAQPSAPSFRPADASGAMAVQPAPTAAGTPTPAEAAVPFEAEGPADGASAIAESAAGPLTPEGRRREFTLLRGGLSERSLLRDGPAGAAGARIAAAASGRSDAAASDESLMRDLIRESGERPSVPAAPEPPARSAADTAMAATPAASPSTGSADAVRPVAEAPQPQLPLEGPARQVVTAARMHLRGESGTVEMHLDPPALGHVRLHVSIENGALTAVLGAETAAAHQMLQDQAGALRQALHDSGLPVQTLDIGLDVSLGGGGSSQGGNPREAGDDGSRQWSGPGNRGLPREAALSARPVPQRQVGIDYLA